MNKKLFRIYQLLLWASLIPFILFAMACFRLSTAQVDVYKGLAQIAVFGAVFAALIISAGLFKEVHRRNVKKMKGIAEAARNTTKTAQRYLEKYGDPHKAKIEFERELNERCAGSQDVELWLIEAFKEFALIEIDRLHKEKPLYPSPASKV